MCQLKTVHMASCVVKMVPGHCCPNVKQGKSFRFGLDFSVFLPESEIEKWTG